MYEYRKLTPEQQAEVVQYRLKRGFPPHTPPHPVKDLTYYILTATCFEHTCHMHQESRREQVLNAIFETFIHHDLDIRAWVVIPNHYHLLVKLENFDVLGGVFRAIHGPTAHQWNLEENAAGRKVWFNFADRAIRSERHYHTTINYIHYNPVKHGWATSPYGWKHSSVHWYLEQYGREWLRDLWVQYPVRDYGRGWDYGQSS